MKCPKCGIEKFASGKDTVVRASSSYVIATRQRLVNDKLETFHTRMRRYKCLNCGNSWSQDEEEMVEDVPKIVITKEILMDRFYHVDKTHLGSEPETLFSDMDDDEENYCPFNRHNWNSNQDILRYLLAFLHDMLRYSNTYKCTVYDEYIHKFELCLLYEEYEWTGHIIDRDINDELHCIYTIYWYKNRGNTEGILKNGRMIDLDDYLQIVHLLLKDPILRKIYIESIVRKDA